MIDSATMNDIINVVVMLFTVIGGYAIYTLRKKAEYVSRLEERLDNLEKAVIVMKTKLFYIEKR